ncbi:hypothetical protein NMY22_g14855 [Coprinellus aureogranulatus]|nr:hypothetical protein NMY22_g14855 [Coprinellus aureogranulatus]
MWVRTSAGGCRTLSISPSAKASEVLETINGTPGSQYDCQGNPPYREDIPFQVTGTARGGWSAIQAVIPIRIIAAALPYLAMQQYGPVAGASTAKYVRPRPWRSSAHALKGFPQQRSAFKSAKDCGFEPIQAYERIRPAQVFSADRRRHKSPRGLSTATASHQWEIAPTEPVRAFDIDQTEVAYISDSGRNESALASAQFRSRRKPLPAGNRACALKSLVWVKEDVEALWIEAKVRH